MKSYTVTSQSLYNPKISTYPYLIYNFSSCLKEDAFLCNGSDNVVVVPLAVVKHGFAVKRPGSILIEFICRQRK